MSTEKNLVKAMAPDNLAYIIYTSALLGNPKGTDHPPQRSCACIQATEDWFHFDSSEFGHSFTPTL